MYDEALTESLRVRLQPSLKAELEQLAGRERRSPSAVARRAIEREVERLRKRSAKEA